MAESVLLSSEGVLTQHDGPILVLTAPGAMQTNGRAAVLSADGAFDESLSFGDPGLSVGRGTVQTITGGSSYQFVLVNPTFVYDDPSPFTGGRIYEASAILKNPAGVAKNLPHQTGFYEACQVQGDGAAFTASRTEFLASPSYEGINGGTVTATMRGQFEASVSVLAGATISSRSGFRFYDATGAGTVTEQIAVEIPTLAKGATNIGIRNASTEVDTPAAQTLSAAGNAITATAKVKALTNSTGGSLTLTSAPTIADGQNGQIVELVNVGAQNIVLQDQGTLANSNLRLTAVTLTLGPRDSLRLRYLSAIGDWVQAGNLVNVL